MLSIIFYPLWVSTIFLVIIFANVLQQKLFRKQNEPPLVFHWFPFIGNAIAYGLDPCTFLVNCREKVKF